MSVPLSTPCTARASQRISAKKIKNAEKFSEISRSKDQKGDEASPPDVVSPAALKMRRYRQRLKESGKFVEFRKKENKIIKSCRARSSEETNKLRKEQARIRLQLHRDRKKALDLPMNTPKNTLTRKRYEKREKDRIRQQQYRAKITPQKKVWINRRQRDQRATQQQQENQMAETLSFASSQASATSASDSFACTGYTNASTQRKAVNKVKERMPESPTKYAAVVEKLANTRSPRKRKALEERGILPAKCKKQLAEQFSANVEDELAGFCRNLSTTRQKKNLKRKASICHLLHKSAKGNIPKLKLQKRLGVGWKFLVRCANMENEDDYIGRKKRSDALSDETCQSVEDYFQRGDVSREDPSTVSVSAKTHEPTRFMEKTLTEAYNHFKEETDTAVSFSKFVSLRPKRTKTVKHNKLNACCCEYCANIELKKTALNCFLKGKGYQEKVLGTKYDIINMTLCPKNPERHLHEKRCLDRKCPDCSVDSVRRHLQEPLNELADTLVSWKAWTLETQTFENRQGQGTTSARRVLAAKEGPFDQLVAELEENLATFACHLTNSQWQHMQFSQISTELPEKWVILVMDFGENYTCHYQDEAQGVYWTRQQVTLHPVVAFYHCPLDGEVMKETFFFISEDLKHDSHAVQHFSQEVMTKLLDKDVEINKIIHFSDGCPSQYKGRTNFIDASFAMNDTGISTEKHFFGSRHGKGPCDAEIGVVKRVAGLAVKRRHSIIATARDFYDFGCSSLTRPANHALHSHQRRSFHFVPANTINRNRPDRTTDTKALQGTRSLHCVRGQQPFLVSHRERTCFCQACIDGEGVCHNEDFCGKWTEARLNVKRRLPRNAPNRPTEE